MKIGIDVDLVEVIRFKLGLLGEKIDESKENKVLFVAWSTRLLDDEVIRSEINQYKKINNPEIFDAEAMKEISEHILDKHILRTDSLHNLRNTAEVFRR